jgi:hypothetical protein
MAYIGKTPITGNFVKLDAISVVNGQAGYTMNNGGSAFTDYENVNQFLVSLNGILQAPTDSFTVSGSTLTFASNLATGDVIDFVIVLGNTLDIGTPSDATVTQAKTNFVSTSSSAGLQIKGDGTTDGTLQLNCSQNSHGIKLKSPSHSAGASYTLTFPTTDGNADEFLQTNGSGVLTWATAGGNNTPAFSAKSASQQSISNTTFTDVDFGTETFDTDNAFASSIFTVPSGKAGKYFLFAQAGRQVWDSDRFLTTIVRTPSGGSGEDIAVGETHDGEGYETTQAFCIADLSVGDAIKVQVYHDSGSTRNISSNFRTTFQGFKLL